jgi:hypothetical protein
VPLAPEADGNLTLVDNRVSDTGARPRLVVATLLMVVASSAAGCGLGSSGGAASGPSPWTLVSGSTANLGTTLGGITCISAQECWAVGASLIDHYDGGSWRAESTQATALQSVACPSPTVCLAVSSESPPGVLSYSGGQWGPDGMAASLGLGTGYDGLSSLACPSISECWAVGEEPHVPRIDEYVGGSWVPVPSGVAVGAPGHESFLSGVACADTSDCWAVGSATTGVGLASTAPAEVPLIERDVNGVWSPVVSPEPPGSMDAGLGAVSCPTSSECWAVGDSEDRDANGVPLIERYAQGQWSIVAGAPLPAAPGTTLTGIACPGPDTCWAVGYQATGSDAVEQLIEEYAGGAWRTVPGATAQWMETSQLHGVTCAPGGSCWAVGSADNADYHSVALIERT